MEALSWILDMIPLPVQGLFMLAGIAVVVWLLYFLFLGMRRRGRYRGGP